MSLPEYEISVYSAQTGAILALLDGPSFFDVRYSRVLNGIGSFAITLPSDTDWPSIFTLDSLIEVKRTSPITGSLQVEETYLTRLTHRFRDGNDERFVVGALSLNHLLMRRLIDPDDDPLAAGGYSTKAGPADDVMRAYVREQCADLVTNTLRKFPNFTVGSTSSLGTSTGKRLRYENLLEVCQDLANSGEVDFQISRVIDNTLRMTIAPIGTNRSQSFNYPVGGMVIVNPIRGNITDPSLLYNRKEEKNYCYAMGQGPGEQRIVQQVAGLGIGDSPYNRIEFTQDVRQAQRGNTLAITTGARAALFDNQAKTEFTFTPTGNEPGAQYNFDWYLGDVITCSWDDEMVDLRVREVQIDLDSSGESMSIKLEPV